MINNIQTQVELYTAHTMQRGLDGSAKWQMSFSFALEWMAPLTVLVSLPLNLTYSTPRSSTLNVNCSETRFTCSSMALNVSHATVKSAKL